MSIFGFSEFLAAFALLVLVYNYTNTVYRFRTAIAPLRFRSLAFISLGISGFGALVTDLWIAESLPAPAFGISHAYIQISLAVIFLSTILAWLFFAFVRPPIFGKRNAVAYLRFVYLTTVNGSEEELTQVVREISRSAKSIVSFAPLAGLNGPKESEKKWVGAAHELLLLLANKRIARRIAVSSPGTLLAMVHEMREQKRIRSVANRFIKSVIEEALLDKTSIIYDETRLFNSDLIGLMQPISGALFSDFDLFDQLGEGFDSPLDLDYRIANQLDAAQFAAYCSLVSLVFEQFATERNWRRHSYALYRCLEHIKDAGGRLYRVDTLDSAAWESDEIQKLRSGVRFISTSLEALDKIEGFEVAILRRREDNFNEDIIDHLAQMFKRMIQDSASIREPQSLAWSVHHNTVWAHVFSLNRGGKATEAFRFKLSRLLFEEIKEMERYPNFVGARILGFLLNIYGMQVPRKEHQYRLRERPLASAVRSWTKRNFLQIWRSNRRVAEAALFGGLSYDAERRTLVKTYAQGTRDEPNTFELRLQAEH